jgi:cytochrome bd-type quinol oxidase subunit 1
LGNFGIGVDNAVASYEESANWKLNDKPVSTTVKKSLPKKSTTVIVDLDQKGTKEVIDIPKMLSYIANQKIKSLPNALKMLADNDYIITNEVKENVSNLFKTKK